MGWLFAPAAGVLGRLEPATAGVQDALDRVEAATGRYGAELDTVDGGEQAKQALTRSGAAATTQQTAEGLARTTAELRDIVARFNATWPPTCAGPFLRKLVDRPTLTPLASSQHTQLILVDRPTDRSRPCPK